MYCALCTISYAQSGELVPKINIPTSPEAALLGKFGDIPVGYYTGTAEVSIPIYTIREGSVEIPVTLRYHGSGIKVEDQATWVGLGWDLSPEGSIIQEIRGKKDDEDNGTNCEADVINLFRQRYNFIGENSYMFLPQWGRSTAINTCHSSYISDPAPSPPWDNLTYAESYCMVDQMRKGYGQPDLYNYSFNGQSGKFYLNPVTKEFVVIDKKDQVYFKKVNGNIQATTLDGTVYTFGAQETADGGIDFEYTGITYKLTSIQLLNGKTISFTYANHNYEERNYFGSAEVNNFTTNHPVTEQYTYTRHNKKTLTRITSTDAIIDFNLSAREDINVYTTNNMQKLSSIDITSRLNNKKIRTFQFTYSYFPYTRDAVQADVTINTNPDAFGKRLKLDSLKEIGYNDAGVQVSSKPAWQFEYDMRYTMPMKVSFAKDIWGYYNGAGNATLLPNLDYFDYFNDPEYKIINQTLHYPYTGANRYTDTALCGAYLLKKIKYPTGGYNEFEYEPNTFTNQFIPLRNTPYSKWQYADDNSITSAANNVSLFKIYSATTIHFENRIMNGRGNPNGLTPLTYGQMADCYISFSKIKTVNGAPVTTVIRRWDLSTVYSVDFDANGGKSWSEDLRVEYDADPTVQYQIKAEFPDNLENPLFNSIAGVSAQLTYLDNGSIDKSQSTQCGLRVKSIKSYTEPGKLASHKVLKYYEGKLLNKFRPLTMYKANHLDISGVTNGNGYEYIAFYKRITINTNDFGTGGGNLIGYGKVEEIELVNGAATSGKKVYYYLNTENKTQQGCPNIPNLLNGLLSKEEVYDNMNVKLQQKDYTYIQLTAPAKYVAMNIVKLATGSKVPCQNYTYPTPYTTVYYASGGSYNTSEYGYNIYTINAQYNKLETVVSREFASGNTLTNTEKYTYNTEGSQRTLTTTNSKGESLITKYYYPNDNMINAAIDTVMTKVHNTGTPVITEQYKGTTLLAKQKTVYGSFTTINTLLPQYIFKQKGGNAEELRVTINSYDDRGNITQYTEQNNIPVSFVWNADKTLPIAKIENATYASLQNLPGGLTADFRTSLPNARVTTYTYKPLIGISTITDVNNRPNYYEYDAFGRLLLVKDHKGNIIKTFDYHYKQ